MKKMIPVLLVVAAIATGCTTQYSIIMNNGDVISARGKPVRDERGYYLYKDINGQTNYVFAGNVREVSPTSIADKGGSRFLK